MNDELVTVSQAAVLLGVSRQSAYRMIKQGRVPVVETSDGLRVPRSVLADVEVFNPGRPRRSGRPNRSEWTRAMTLRRVREWNDALVSGELTYKGRPSKRRIRAFEREHGWRYEDLVRACERWFGYF